MAAEARDQLVVPVIDGLVIDGFHAKFSGTVHLDPTDAGDLNLIEDLKLGRRVSFQVVVDVDGGSPKVNRDNGGAIKTVVEARQLVVRRIDSHSVVADAVLARPATQTLDEAIPPLAQPAEQEAPKPRRRRRTLASVPAEADAPVEPSDPPSIGIPF